MEKFHPSNRVPFTSFILMILAVIAGGAVIGAIVAFVHQYFYLVFVEPLLMGLAGGGLLALIVRGGKVRSPFMAALFGLLIGLVTYGVYRYAAYYLDSQKIIAQVGTQEGLSAAESQLAFDQVLNERFGRTGFIGYEQFVAEQGITFTSTYSVGSEGGTTLQGNLVYAYWIFEILLVTIMAAYVAAGPARRPFCENCGTWYAGRARIGSVGGKSGRQFVDLLKNGRFSEAKAMYSPPSNPPRTDLEMEYCKTCQNSDVVVTAKRIVRSGRNRTNTSVQARGVVDRQRLPELLPTPTPAPAPTPGQR